MDPTWIQISGDATKSTTTVMLTGRKSTTRRNRHNNILYHTAVHILYTA